MLVLSRHLFEDIVMTAADGTEITVQVVEVRRGKIRLGITAPKSVTIDRREIHNDKLTELARQGKGDAA